MFQTFRENDLVRQNILFVKEFTWINNSFTYSGLLRKNILFSYVVAISRVTLFSVFTIQKIYFCIKTFYVKAFPDFEAFSKYTFSS